MEWAKGGLEFCAQEVYENPGSNGEAALHWALSQVSQSADDLGEGAKLRWCRSVEPHVSVVRANCQDIIGQTIGRADLSFDDQAGGVGRQVPAPHRHVWDLGELGITKPGLEE